MAVVFNLGTNGNWAYEDASLLPYYVDANNKYNGVRMSAFRAGIATRTTREGLLESMTVDIPRIDFAENANGQLFVEDESENLVVNSNSGDYGSAPASEISESSPAGDDTAVRPVVSGVANRYEQIISGGTYPTGQKLVYSWYRKRISTPINDNEIGDLRVANSINLIEVSQTQIESERNGYDRFQSVVEIVDGSLESKWRGYFGDLIGIGNSSVAYWGHQFEEGENATSLIPTNGSAEPRAADTGITTGDISHLINSEEGVIEISMRALVNGGKDRRFSLNDGTTSNRIEFGYSNAENKVEIIFRYGGNSTSLNVTVTIGDQTEKGIFKLKWKSGDSVFSFNNTILASSSDVFTFTPNVLKYANLTTWNQTSSPLFAKVEYIKIYDSADDY